MAELYVVSLCTIRLLLKLASHSSGRTREQGSCRRAPAWARKSLLG
jgi:hypothetical protein